MTIFAPATYNPGQTYTILVEVEDPTAQRWGFEITALDRNLNGAGSFNSLDAETQVSSSSGIQYAKHTSLGTSPGTTGGKSWQVQWTAPASNVGPVRFYGAGNGANANSSSAGDQIYTTAVAAAGSAAKDATVTLQPETTTVNAGDNWRVKASVRDHTGAANDVILVSRVRLPNGTFFPSNGWLFPPDSISLSANNWVVRDLDHVIPASAPRITAVYQAIIGRAPSTVVDIDEFAFDIQ